MPTPKSSLPTIVYEDDALICFDKPSGMLIAPDRWDKTRPSLVGMILERWKGEVVNVHRLDADTSGLIVCAKGKPYIRLMASQFERRVVDKRYLALVRGQPAESDQVISKPLGPDKHKLGRMRVDKREGRPASTRVHVLERFRDLALVECFPMTGRTHQIRVHLVEIECPIVCDPFYGTMDPVLLSQIKRSYKPKEEERPLLARLALHSTAATFTHPVTGLPITIEAPLPKDMALALKYLRQYGRLAVSQRDSRASP
ncbi:MAG: RluA family pseudouridine synthase [Verrucomicrobiota bacterium]|nr:RluA family pseudouridine synthase [Verrucomicrobiota bacterium]